MGKTAKIEKITGSKERTGPNGTVHYISVEMDNGDKGTIGKKSKDALSVGDELTYELVEKEFNGNITYNIKEVKENTFQKKSGGYTRNYKADFISFAMSYAKDLSVAGKIDMFVKKNNNEIDLAICESADLIYHWMCTKYDEINKPTQTQPITTQPTTTDSFPF